MNQMQPFMGLKDDPQPCVLSHPIGPFLLPAPPASGVLRIGISWWLMLGDFMYVMKKPSFEPSDSSIDVDVL